jgi:hypothetical protein
LENRKKKRRKKTFPSHLFGLVAQLAASRPAPSPSLFWAAEPSSRFPLPLLRASVGRPRSRSSHRSLPLFADGWGPLSIASSTSSHDRAGVELVFNRIYPSNLGFPSKTVTSWGYKSVAASTLFSFSILTSSRTTSTRV